MQQVYKHYGPYGIYRGFRTSYYSATTGAFAFFIVYKGMKQKMREYFQPATQQQCSLIYLVASVCAEAISMFIYYPYEILKVRMITKNDTFGYKSIPDAFHKIFKSEGVRGWYKGYPYFLVNFVLSNTIQLVIYETYMDLKKKKVGNREFKLNEGRYVIEAALLGGFITGSLLNSFECVMYMKMAEQVKGKTLLQIYKDSGTQMLTKGVGTRILMTQGYSLLYFNLLYYLGLAFDCDLLDEMDDEYLESL
eukprot:CAMPEP_0168621744 /NCGR_PEP_ID=MMETSP0449_2-20121227/7870_1 /TAXON_ID=1082188 /ORGANISM="Strombidium rassoulzadegani, Strain ras09" /LENGTH=249 /DNA_ID=CAMNT_0008662909 /DNA_START=574 /DNA_END=1319 /DNA_ORIENTATION=+